MLTGLFGMSMAEINEWNTSHHQLFTALNQARAEYTFWGGRKFVLPKGEKVSLFTLRSRIEALYSQSQRLEETSCLMALKLKQFDFNNLRYAYQQVLDFYKLMLRRQIEIRSCLTV